MKKIFLHVDKCTGCKSCELACAIEHSRTKSLYTAVLERPRPRNRIYVEFAAGKAVPVHCHHCEDAPCLNACISGSIHRDPDRDTVILARDKCIGCWSCIMMCPIGVIGRVNNGRPVAFKCDRCPDLDVPACVAGCPTRALELAEAESFARTRRVEAASSIAMGG
jgi:carbon-monoxide dehydrogenase iron sulfur subunit